MKAGKVEYYSSGKKNQNEYTVERLAKWTAGSPVRVQFYVVWQRNESLRGRRVLLPD